MQKFWDQVYKDLDFRRSQVLIPSWFLVIISLVGFLLLVHKIIFLFDWFYWIIAIVFIYALCALIKRSGYDEGYAEGAGDMGERANYLIEYDK